MKSINTFILGLLLSLISSSSIIAQQGESQLAVVDGKKLSYRTFNLEKRKAGEPVLVFETGLGGGTFDPLLGFFPGTVSGIQYERNGIGQSEQDSRVVSDTQVVERLHALLQTLAVKPPYLLVGHSIGGAYIRLFAAKYPDEVCGLVFSDPTDFMLSADENKEAMIRSKSATGYREVSAISIKSMSENQNFRPGARYDAARALKAGYFIGYGELPPLKSSIAATVIISYNKNIEAPDEELNQKLHLGINFKSWWKEYDDLRIQHYSELIKDNDRSMIVLLPKYSHRIYFQNPELVAKLILDNYRSHIK